VEQEVLLRRRESRFEGEEELSFRHALLREGANAMLTADDRTLGHRLAGQWLEARGEQDARALAEHFEKGGDWPSAGQHYVRAVHQATWGGDVLGSIAPARRGLALPIPSELRVRLLGVLCETSIWRPETADSMRREAEELVQVAARGSVPWVQGMMSRLTSASLERRLEEYIALAGELQRAEVAPDAMEPMALALGGAVFALDMMGYPRRADPLLATLESLMRACADPSPLAVSLFYACAMMRADGDLFGDMNGALKAQELAREAGSRSLESCAAVYTAIHAWCLGAVEEAERTLRSVAVADAELGYVSTYRPFALAWLLADRGALREAEACAAEVVALGQSHALPGDQGRGHWIVAEVRRRAGDLDGADEEVEAAVAIFRAHCQRDLPGAWPRRRRSASRRAGRMRRSPPRRRAWRSAGRRGCAAISFEALSFGSRTSRAWRPLAVTRKPAPRWRRRGAGSSRSPSGSRTPPIERAFLRTSPRTAASSRSRANGSARRARAPPGRSPVRRSGRDPRQSPLQETRLAEA
jgi:hypothetical protein